MTLSPETLTQLEQLAKAATPGKRFANKIPGTVALWQVHTGDESKPIFSTRTKNDEANAKFDAALDPQTVLALIAGCVALTEIDDLDTGQEPCRFVEKVKEILRKAAAAIATKGAGE